MYGARESNNRNARVGSKIVIRVLLVHESSLLRSALVALVGAEPDMEVVAASFNDARRRARSVRPHVCVVDADCTSYDRAAKRKGLSELGDECAGGALLVLADAERPGPLRRAYDARALGYIDKNAPPDRLLAGIRKVARGERYVDDALGFGFLQAAEIPLTDRELSVLSLAAEGASVADIARDLHLSNGTIRNYMAAITRKTGARNRVDAINISRGAGWV